MAAKIKKTNLKLKVYHGYGHTHNLVVYGHVLMNKQLTRGSYTNNIGANIIHIVRLFMVKPAGGIKVTMQWGNQLVETISEKDGFFKLEWKSETSVPAGWHPVDISIKNENGETEIRQEGKVFIPHVTQYAFISDIDDTVLVSHSATILKRLRVLFTKNPRTRKAFSDVVSHYSLLSSTGTEQGVPNPFFYVSSSEWNLYDDLVDFFSYNYLPEGIFLLNQMKQWFELVKTGKTKHDGKLVRVMRILDAFPKQQFVLLGDNSQKDPDIYTAIAKKYPHKIFAIYIRNIKPENEESTSALFAGLAGKDVYTCLFKDNQEAIAHSRSIGLIA